MTVMRILGVVLVLGGLAHSAGVAHLYATALRMRGVECSRAADGFAALRAIEQQRPDLILLDIDLPMISGFTIIRDLEQDASLRHIPVVVVTGVDPTPELQHALVVMRKPCDPEYVAKIITDHLPPVRQGTLQRR